MTTEERRLYMSQWREKNRQKVNDYQRNWRKNNLEKAKVIEERSREKHPQNAYNPKCSIFCAKEKREAHRLLWERDPEHMRELGRRWKQKYPERNRESQRKFLNQTPAIICRNHYQRWTVSQDNLILQAKFTDLQLHEMTGRTIGAIETRRGLLKRGEAPRPVFDIPR